MKAKEIAQAIISKEVKPLCFNEVFGYDNSEIIYSSETYSSFFEKLSSLPVLTGTEKQISWATEIRNNFITSKAFNITSTLVNMWVEHLQEGKEELQEPFRSNFNKRGSDAIKASKTTNAAWWIENRKYLN